MISVDQQHGLNKQQTATQATTRIDTVKATLATTKLTDPTSVPLRKELKLTRAWKARGYKY